MLLGADIGGTTVSIGLVGNGKVLERRTFPSFERTDTLELTMSRLTGMIDQVIRPEVTSIGIGVPSVVDCREGIVYDTANIPSWKEVHLKEMLQDRYGIPVSVNNDANCYAIGAFRALERELEGPDSVLVGVTLGTGVGIGIVHGGKLFNGHNTGAGELSCAPYLDTCIEDYCSSKLFARYGRTARELSDDAANGSREALGVFEEFGHHLGHLLLLVMYAYDPSTIVLGGGISGAFDLFERPMMDYLSSRFVYSRSLANTRITVLNDSDVALVGAACL